MSLITKILLVALGGSIGSVLRFISSLLYKNTTVFGSFPISTFTINILGCFLIGVFNEYIARSFELQEELRLLLVTGILGGFTTFSTFGLEVLMLLKNGELCTGLLYATSSVVLGLLAVYAGMRVHLQ